MTLPSTRAASRPLFWLALLLLVLNDHFLKGAGLLPDALTGKLSDFAGLIVAPVVLAALVRARSPQARGACLAAVGIGFSAINLLPPVAGFVEGLLRWSITVDPSDLVALPALGLSWWAMAERGERTRVALAKVGIAFGLVACMATSSADEAGSCTVDADCGSSWLCCDGTCIDPEWHDDHCGGCDLACPAATYCQQAECESTTESELDPELDVRPALVEEIEALRTDPDLAAESWSAPLAPTR